MVHIYWVFINFMSKYKSVFSIEMQISFVEIRFKIIERSIWEISFKMSLYFWIQFHILVLWNDISTCCLLWWWGPLISVDVSHQCQPTFFVRARQDPQLTIHCTWFAHFNSYMPENLPSSCPNRRLFLTHLFETKRHLLI